MPIEEIQEFQFHYTPWESNFPIRSVTVTIIARSRKEAELINLDNNYKFFDQDCTIRITEGKKGYRQVT